jgi:hypothetical protein
MNKEFWKMQLHPGDEYHKLHRVSLRDITQKLNHGALPSSAVQSSAGSDSKSR